MYALLESRRYLSHHAHWYKTHMETLRSKRNQNIVGVMGVGVCGWHGHVVCVHGEVEGGVVNVPATNTHFTLPKTVGRAGGCLLGDV